MDWPEISKYRGIVSSQNRGEIIKDLYSSYEDPVKGLVHRGMIRYKLFGLFFFMILTTLFCSFSFLNLMVNFLGSY